jgi:hypothetical protein
MRGHTGRSVCRSGDFEQAITYENQALSLTNAVESFLDKAKQRLELYQRREPYREEPR